MKQLARLARGLPNLFTWMAGIIFALVLILLVCLEGPLQRVYQSGALLPNWQLFLMALALLIAGIALWLWRKKTPSPLASRRPPRMVLWLSLAHVALFAVQLVLVRSLWFYPSWDPGACVEAAQQLASGTLARPAEYFALCPNNAPLTLLITVPLWVGMQLGLAVPYLLLPITGALFANLTSLLTCLCAWRLTHSRLATLFCSLLAVLFVGLSPFQSIAYTDSLAILFPVLALFLYLGSLRSPWKWFFITLCCSLGALIKPTVWICWLALVLLAGARALPGLLQGKQLLRRGGAILLALLVGYLPTPLLGRAINLHLTGEATPQAQLGMAHYLMLGLNQETMGGHSVDDVAFSTSFATLAERNQANYAKAWQRLTAMSLPQAGAFFSGKLFKAFGSGTFAWNGSFLEQEVPRRQDSVSLFLRSIYYTRGTWNPLYKTIFQGLWLLVLLLCTLGLWLGRKRQPQVPLLGLSLLGLALYQCLFECWPRYLLVYVPFFLLLGTLGMRALLASLKRFHFKG